jgi:DNA-binding response OmpR family regulator
MAAEILKKLNGISFAHSLAWALLRRLTEEIRAVSIVAKGRQMILLVEDDIVTRYAFARLLRVAGYEVMEAADGNEALTLLDRYQIELVVTDLEMPVLNGFSLITRIRNRWPTMPIILISGYLSQSAGDVILRESGYDAKFVQKPVMPSALVAAVRNLLLSSTSH